MSVVDRTIRPGVSLVELMVALALFSIVLATTLGFYRQQGKAFTDGNRRMTVMQNLRYGVNTVETNLRTAGVNVPTEQPVLVYAGTDVVAFNADYASNLADDFLAVYYDRLLPDAAVSALTPARSLQLPGTSFTYPDSAYYMGSGTSTAETITFYFEPDTTTARGDDYALYRQVNDLPPDVVARRILPTDREFFTYYVLEDDGSGPAIREVPTSYLPSAHTVPIHGSPADTGLVAGVDSVRAIRISYAASNGLTGPNENVRAITRMIRLPNAGLATQPTCGNRPILGSSLGASGVAPTETVDGHIRLDWVRATDEATGEQDVIRYVLWRQEGDGSGNWGSPLASVPAGLSTYSYRDFSAEQDISYSYALAAQDCTPQYSDVTTAGPASWDAN